MEARSFLHPYQQCWSNIPVRNDEDVLQVFPFHDDILKNVATVFPRVPTAANRGKSLFTAISFIPFFFILISACIQSRDEGLILISVEDEDGPTAGLSRTNERQLSSTVQAIVDDQSTRPLTRANLNKIRLLSMALITETISEFSF